MSNKAHTQAFFHSHFLGEKHNGLMNDCDIVIIDKTNPQNLLLRMHAFLCMAMVETEFLEQGGASCEDWKSAFRRKT
jgi:hypothetical protein